MDDKIKVIGENGNCKVILYKHGYYYLQNYYPYLGANKRYSHLIEIDPGIIEFDYQKIIEYGGFTYYNFISEDDVTMYNNLEKIIISDPDRITPFNYYVENGILYEKVTQNIRRILLYPPGKKDKIYYIKNNTTLNSAGYALKTNNYLKEVNYKQHILYKQNNKFSIKHG